MARRSTNITADSNVEAVRVRPRGENELFEALVFIQGTFGSGTATLQISPDRGTTKHDVLNPDGSVASFTANGYVKVQVPFARKNDEELILYVDLSGATNPDIDVVVFDNA